MDRQNPDCRCRKPLSVGGVCHPWTMDSDIPDRNDVAFFLFDFGYVRNNPSGVPIIKVLRSFRRHDATLGDFQQTNPQIVKSPIPKTRLPKPTSLPPFGGYQKQDSGVIFSLYHYPNKWRGSSNERYNNTHIFGRGLVLLLDVGRGGRAAGPNTYH